MAKRKPRREKTIPEIRERMYVLAKKFRCRELYNLAEDTKRRTFGPKARVQQAPITPDVVLAVRKFVRENPRMHQRKVGRVFGIDGGRVHEILHGYRDGRYYSKAGVLHGKA